MHSEDFSKSGFWCATGLAALAAPAAWLVLLLREPPCGAPPDTFLGRGLSYGPIVLLVAQTLVVVGLGRWAHRRPGSVLGAILLAGVFAVTAGILIFLFWFAGGDCGE